MSEKRPAKAGFFHFKVMSIHDNTSLPIHLNKCTIFMDHEAESAMHNDAAE